VPFGGELGPGCMRAEYIRCWAPLRPAFRTDAVTTAVNGPEWVKQLPYACGLLRGTQMILYHQPRRERGFGGKAPVINSTLNTIIIKGRNTLYLLNSISALNLLLLSHLYKHVLDDILSYLHLNHDFYAQIIYHLPLLDFYFRLLRKLLYQTSHDD
jgi:hypothetical protein